MTDRLTIALGQANPTVGALADNLKKARAFRAQAAEAGADLLALPELFLSGYPPEDLVLKPAFLADCRAALEALARDTADGGPAVLIGTPHGDRSGVHNAAALLEGGEVRAMRLKYELPNYGVFDEKRVFTAGPLPGPIAFRGVRLGVLICEDMWFPEVAECLEETGAELMIALNGSPYETDKAERRMVEAVARVVETGLPLAFVNQIGGQDELVFDGASFALNADRRLAVQGPAWEEALIVTRWARGEDGRWSCAAGLDVAPAEGLEAVYRAMVTGLRDYVEKNRFPGVVLGLSGGVDSALSAAVAVDALGADRVWCVMLPYRYTSEESLRDARDCAEALGCRYDVVPIESPVVAANEALAGLFQDREADVTEENIQSRMRGLLLMAISNKFGVMVLTTGNKSEVSVGYATLYGDMCGGFSVLKDVYKTEVFELCRWRNAHRPVDALGPEGVVVPPNVIQKPPSAELREDQKDEDSLPPYDALDDMLQCLIEGEMGVGEIVARGHDAETLARVQHLLYISEYKRRQAAPGVKITRKQFGLDRRYPITNHYRDRE